MSRNVASGPGNEGGNTNTLVSVSPAVLPALDHDHTDYDIQQIDIDLDINGVTLHEGTTSTSTAQMPITAPVTPSESASTASSSRVGSLFTDVANMLKAFIGLNFMYVAYAFAQAGLVRGVIGLCLIALITEHCCLLLVDVKSRMPAKPGSSKPPTYGDIGRFVGGRPVEYMVNGALMVTQFGYCVGYLIFMSQTIHDVFQKTNGTWMYVLFPVPILIGIAMLKSIRSLGPFSILANIALLTGFVAVVVYIGKHFKYHVGTATWGTYPLFFGQMTAALEGIGLVIPVETSMKDPSQFPFVLRIALFILISVLMTVGTLGYMTFGAETKSILLLNFGQSPVVNVVKVILILGILFTYPLQIFPVFQLFENWVAKRAEKRAARNNAANANGILGGLEEGNSKSGQIPKEGVSSNMNDDDGEGELLVSTEEEEMEDAEWREKKERFVQEPWKVMFRLGVVLATAITAMMAGANFGLFQSLVGSLGASCLAYSAPAYFHVTVFGRTLSRGEKLKDWLIFAFGVLGAIIGTICTLMEFAEKRQHGHV